MSQRPPIDQQITFIYVADLNASARFYGEVLGLPLALDQGTCRIYRASRDAYLGTCLRRPGMEDAPNSVILTLVTQDVDGWYTALIAQGVTFEKPPTFNPTYNIYHLFLRDPDGYLIEIQRFEHPFG
jgi:catechol 2,3-dioxygenase-like lactoylglutathione lyase family enzyme